MSRHAADPSRVKRTPAWTRAIAAQRAQQGWMLRVGGASWDTVASECGYASATTACRAVGRFCDGLPKIDIDRMRAVAVQRGEDLWREVWQDVLDRKPGATTSAVRVLTRQAALLGLDQPTEITLHTPTTAELERWINGVLSQQTAATPIEAVVIGEAVELEAASTGELTP